MNGKPSGAGTLLCPRTKVCLRAYSAYAAYVENDMAMRLRRKRKTGCSRVLCKKHGVSYDQEFPSLVKIDVSDQIRADSSNHNFSITSVLPAYIDLHNAYRESPTLDGNAIMKNPPPISNTTH